ncbi:hypothetical protein PWG14_25210 [Chromobacterium amazonense]|uniref:hypothetical protein n=1 Tax=Chromobacterium amazonense TaxID=1382803 RepID=UPI00237DBB6F|nr:hypothetical protein [Chromobacterium amazonense]MDE1715770.1 hypothetical protein [Chromobacterium amazonense]
MQLKHITRNAACILNPLIGMTTRDTMQNIIRLLDGQCSLIADRSAGAQLDGEVTINFLQFVGGAVHYEAEAGHTEKGNS